MIVSKNQQNGKYCNRHAQKKFRVYTVVLIFLVILLGFVIKDFARLKSIEFRCDGHSVCSEIQVDEAIPDIELRQALCVADFVETITCRAKHGGLWTVSLK